MGVGCVIWLTGLPSAGKTTIASQVVGDLKGYGKRAELLDGDAVRKILAKGLGFSKEDRDENIRRIGYVADLLSRNGVAVVVSVISPYRAVRDEIREQVDNFIEVFVDCPLEECIKRDVRGLYKKALKGEIKGFTGISDPYEAPVKPELRLETHKASIDECVGAILKFLKQNALLLED